MKKQTKNRILGYVEKALDKGYWLRQRGDAGDFSGFVNDSMGCCVLGVITLNRDASGVGGVRSLAARILGVDDRDAWNLEAGFEGEGEVTGLDCNDEFYLLGREIADTYM